MKNVVITVLAVLVLGLGGYLVYDKVIDKKEVKCNCTSNEETKYENETKEENKEEVKFKIVKSYVENGKYTDEATCTGEYNETFNNINVKIAYSGCNFDDHKFELKVNGEKLTKILNLSQFAFYNNYLILINYDTSFISLEIYDSVNKNFVYSSSEAGYRYNDFTIEGNKIIFTGSECGEQCGLESSGYKYTKFEFEYENGKLKEPVLVDKWN